MVLCAASEYFIPLLDPDRHFTDSRQTAIELQGDDPNAIYTMIRYIYTAEYEVEEENPMGHLEVYKAARKYLIPSLSEEAITKFRSSCTEFQDVCANESDGEGLLRLVEAIATSRVRTPILTLCRRNTC
jgi:hypothetical protein